MYVVVRPNLNYLVDKVCLYQIINPVVAKQFSVYFYSLYTQLVSPLN